MRSKTIPEFGEKILKFDVGEIEETVSFKMEKNQPLRLSPAGKRTI